LFVNDETRFENEQTLEELSDKSIGEIKEKSRSGDIFKSANSRLICQHDIIFDEGPSLEAISLRSWTPSPSAKRERIGSDEKSSGLEARLRRVENLLERRASGSIISKPMSHMDDSCLLGHSGNEYADMGSTKLSFEGLRIDRDTEVESFKREIWL